MIWIPIFPGIFEFKTLSSKHNVLAAKFNSEKCPEIKKTIVLELKEIHKKMLKKISLITEVINVIDKIC